MEWQLACPDLGTVRRRLSDHGTVDGLVLEPRSSLQILDTYLDADDWRFHRADFALRIAILTLLGRDRRERVAIVGHQPGLGVLLAACLLGEDAALPFELKRNAVACVSFAGSPRAGRGTLQWLAAPRMLRGLRRDG